MTRSQKYRCVFVSILIFVVVYSQHAHGIDTSVPYSAATVDDTSPLMTKQGKSAQPFQATANLLLQGAAAAWMSRNFTHAAHQLLEALVPSNGKDRQVWSMLRQFQQYLTQRAENSPLRILYRGLISANYATLDDLVEFSYIAAHGDDNTGMTQYKDAKQVISIIERFRRVPGLMHGLNPSYRAKIHFAMGRLFDALGNHEVEMEANSNYISTLSMNELFDGISSGTKAEDFFHRAFMEFSSGNLAATAPVEPSGQGGNIGHVAKSVRECVEMIDHVKQTFDFDRIGKLRQSTAKLNYTHVFIVGFPRSGTSLVDQIIAAHPNVWSRGEHSELQYVASWLEEAMKGGYGKNGVTADQSQRAQANAANFVRTRLRWPHISSKQRNILFESLSIDSNYSLSDAAFQTVVDALNNQWEVQWKPPNGELKSNITHVVSCVSFDINLLWLLPTMFPSSRVIFVERCPLDVAISNYVTNFVLHETAWCGLHYAFDFQNIVKIQESYHSLIDHWSNVLQNTAKHNNNHTIQIKRIRYETLVGHASHSILDILEFLGLPFSENCMHHHRPYAGGEVRWKGVSTASLTQVKKPIYGARVGRWKHYRTQLGESLDIQAKSGPGTYCD